MNIHEKLSLIQQEFKAKKSRYNSFGKYNFRSAEDILEALKPFNEKYKVYFTVNEKYLGDGILNLLHLYLMLMVQILLKPRLLSV